mgnify:FL=1
MSPPNATPLKEAELRALATCAHCHKKISETGIPTFFKVTIESHILNIPAIQRQQGLGMILGGGLALHMGADEDMTVTLEPPRTVMVCQVCSLEPRMLAQLTEP